MKRLLALAGSAALVMIVISTYQIAKGPSGLAVMRGGSAFAADMAPPRMPPPLSPMGKGKAPVGKAPMGKGKAPIYTKG